MGDCQKCRQFPELHSHGRLLFYSKVPDLYNILKSDRIADLADRVEEEDRVIAVSYSSFHQIEVLLNTIEKSFSVDQKRNILASYTSGEKQEYFLNMAPFQQFYERLQNRDYLTIINQRKFTQHLQPIFKLQEDEVFG